MFNLVPLAESEIETEAMFDPLSLTEPELESEGEFNPMPLSSEPVTSLSNKLSSLQSFKPEKNSMPLQLELVTSLSNKSPSIQPFLLTSLEEHDPFQIFLTRTSSMKWGIVAVPSH